MRRFRDFVARKLPATKVRIGSRLCETAIPGTPGGSVIGQDEQFVFGAIDQRYIVLRGG